jgi:hypothetical protein
MKNIKTPTLKELNIVMCDQNAKDYKCKHTSLFGEITTDYKKIVNLLGEPNAETDGYKVDAEWELEMNGKTITIYNYKDGKNYCGRHGLPLSKIKNWHIGSEEDISEEIKILAEALDGKVER